jgi:para-aminobenzoate synthetase component I
VHGPPALVSVVEDGAPGLQPLEALRRLAGRPGAFLRWAAGGPRDLTGWSFAGSDPVASLVVSVTRRGPQRDPWVALERLRRRVRRLGPRIPFAGGWFGTIGYELRAAVERIPPPRPSPRGFPALHLARYDAVVAWDHSRRRVLVAGTGTSARDARARARRLLDRLEAPPPARGGARGRRPRRLRGQGRVVAATSPADYRRQVADVVERIRAGDLFQANLSQRFDGPLAGSPLDLFERIARRSPVPFLSYVDLGGGRLVLSASPERFLSLEGDAAETRPMKGTRPRGATAAADRRLRAELASSEKERAELAMIVDLARNDVGRACRPGSVRVAVARRLERYATVHQAVAVVRGRLLPGASGVDLLRGAFPPGSVTGAPKIEAMKVIDALEREPRGPYCGAIGWLDDGGDFDWAVAIRTACVDGDRVSWRVGGGVTLASDPREELLETLVKGRALAAAVTSREGEGP